MPFLPVPVIAEIADEIIGDIAAPYVSIYSAVRQIGGIIPDVTIREVLNDSFTITQHPVEGGTPVSDHTFANPKQIELTVGWSDSTGGFPGYVQLAYQTLIALAATREVFDVDTGKRSYSNMLFLDITVPTDLETEFTLIPTIRLQEVIITTTDDGSGDSTIPQTTDPAQNLGNQMPVPYGQGGIGGDGKFVPGPAAS